MGKPWSEAFTLLACPQGLVWINSFWFIRDLSSLEVPEGGKITTPGAKHPKNGAWGVFLDEEGFALQDPSDHPSKPLRSSRAGERLRVPQFPRGKWLCPGGTSGCLPQGLGLARGIIAL